MRLYNATIVSTSPDSRSAKLRGSAPLREILIACCLLIAAGCNKGADTTANAPAPAPTTTTTTTGTTTSTNAQSDLVGQWSGTAEPGGTKLTYDIKPDTLTQNSENEVPGATKPMKTTMEATYTVSGNKMSVKATKMELSSDDPKLKADFEKTNAALTQDFLAKQPAQEWTFEMKDKDTLVITSKDPNGKPIVATLKRGGGASTGAAPAPENGTTTSGTTTG